MHHPVRARTACAWVLAAGLAFAAQSATAAPYSSLVVFGDSLSDKGNFFQATGAALPQAADYSIGPVAVEFLAQGLGLGLKDYALYWDKIHASAITHQVLGQGMLAAVPEPQSMQMMAAGLLALGRRNGA